MWITSKLGISKNGFTVRENRAYLVLTISATLFIAAVSLGYFQVSWARMLALGCLPGIVIILWVQRGIYLKPEATVNLDSSPPPVRPQSVPPATEPQNLVEPSDMPTPQS